MLVVGISSIIGVVVLEQPRHTLNNVVTPAIGANRDLVLHVVVAQSALRGYAATQDPMYDEAYRGVISHITETNDELAGYAGSLDADIATLIRGENEAVQKWLVQQNALRDRIANGQPNPGLVAETSAKDVRSFNTRIGDRLEELSSSLTDISRRLYWAVAALILALTLAAVLFSRTLTRRARSQLAEPLATLRDVVGAATGGGVDIRADPSVGVVEVRDLATTFNRLIDRTSRIEEAQDSNGRRLRRTVAELAAMQQATSREQVYAAAEAFVVEIGLANSAAVRSIPRGPSFLLGLAQEGQRTLNIPISETPAGVTALHLEAAPGSPVWSDDDRAFAKVVAAYIADRVTVLEGQRPTPD